jgi:hypothetical protein
MPLFQYNTLNGFWNVGFTLEPFLSATALLGKGEEP